MKQITQKITHFIVAAILIAFVNFKGFAACTPPAGTVTSAAGTNMTCNSFQANWSISATTNVTDYEIGVSTSATFASYVAGYPQLVGGTSATTSFTPYGLAASTTYYFRIRAYNSSAPGCYGSSYSNTITVVTSASGTSICNCAAYGTTNTYGYIKNVTLNTINRTSVYDGYINTGLSTSLTQGVTYTFNITTHDNSTYSIYSEAWIDWSGNGSFADAGEIVMASSNTSASGDVIRTVSVTVPGGATAGSTKMRVMFKNNAACSADGCDVSSIYEDVEDYNITIVAPAACTGTPFPGTASISSTSGCPNVPITLSSAGYNIASGLTYQWQQSTDGGATWVAADTATAIAPNSITVTPSATTSYNLYVSCGNSANDSTSNIVTYTVVLSSACYCTPTNNGSNAYGYMSNVTFPSSGGINRTSVWDGYIATGLNAVVNQGVAYTLSVTKTITNPASISAWIDWNGNGSYADAGEEVMIYPSNTTATQTQSITIPFSTISGTTNMRVMFKYNAVATTDGCDAVSTYKDVEDYTITINSTPCSGTPSAGTTSISATSGCTGSGITLSNTGYSLGSGLSYQWQKSINGGSTYSNFGSSAASYSSTTDNPTVTSSYRLQVTCSNSGLISYSNVVTFTVAAPGPLTVRTWVGKGSVAAGAGTDFNTAENWSPAAIPTACDSIRIILTTSATITMSANCTVGAMVYTAGGTDILDVKTFVLTVIGTTTTDASSSLTIQLGAYPAGMVCKGNVFYHLTGAGTSYLRATVTSPGKFECDGNLTIGTKGRTLASYEPRLIFDGTGTQTIYVNNTGTYFLGENIIFGVNNSPTIVLAGGPNYQWFGVYDGGVQINNSTIVQANRNNIPRVASGGSGTFYMANGSRLEVNYSFSFPGADGFGNNYPTYSLQPTSTTIYLGAATSQTVKSLTYGHLISGGSGNKTAGGTITVQGNFTVQLGSTYLGSTFTHNLKGDYTNNGTFTANTSTFIFNGAVAQNLYGTSASTFYNLTMNNALGLTIAPTTGLLTNVSNILTLTSGRINNNGYVLAVTNTATTSVTGQSTSSYVNTGATGWLRRYVAATGSYDFPVGNSNTGAYELANINLTSGNTTTYLDCNFDNPSNAFGTGLPLTSVTPAATYSYLLDNGGGAATSGAAYGGIWTVTPNSGTATYTVSLYGRNFTNGSGSNTCVKRATAGSAWGLYGTFVSSTTTAPISCVRSAVSGFSQHAIATGVAPLPIELTSFTSNCITPNVVLNWTTATETNNDYFTLDKSLDGVNFVQAGIVKGAGNSSSTNKYSFTDYNSFSGIAYYRLTQTDYNGHSESFNVISAENCNDAHSTLNAFNNNEGSIVVSINAETSGKYTVTLTDALGHKLLNKQCTTDQGENNYKLDISTLNAGIYFIIIDDGKVPVTKKVFVK